MNKYIFLVYLSIIGLKPAIATMQVSFDEEFLKSRGIDTSIAKQFSQAPVFLAGKQELKIYINSQYRASIEVDIKDDGQICLNSKLLYAIGLNDPRILNRQNDCEKIYNLWKNSEIIQKPSKQELWFFVPSEAVIENFNEQKKYIYGGNGALVNYSANYMGSSGLSNNNMYYLNTEAGFNRDNWLFRSYQVYNHFSNSDFIHQYAYAQTTLEKHQKTVQIGKVNLNNNIIGSYKMVGLQVFPENKLENNDRGFTVTGIANESSMVEIYQLGRLIYNIAVPSGKFEIENVTLLNNTSDLTVKVKGVYGQEQQFIIPASSFSHNMPFKKTGYSIALGRYDEENSTHKPLVFSISKGLDINHSLGVEIGTLVSPDYFASGINSSINIFNSLVIFGNTAFSYDKVHNKNGGLFSGTISYLVADDLSISSNLLIQGSDYTYISDAVKNEKPINNKQKQIGSDINWLTKLGTLGSSIGRTYTTQEKPQDYISFSWSQSLFDNVIFSTSYQRTYNTDHVYDDAFYFRLSIPLEKANISTSLTKNNNINRFGTRYNNYTSRDKNWGVAYDYSDQNHYQSVAANVQTVSPYGQLGGNFRRDNQQQTSWGTSISGAVAVVDKEILFSSYEIKDTFGVAKAGDKSNIRIDTSAGSAWTNHNGYAVISSLNPYQKNPVKVDTKSLSRQSDILNAYKIVTPAKGSIVPVNFSVIEARRVRVNIQIEGKPLPLNSVIKDETGNFLTLATQPGEFFLGKAIPNMKLHIDTPDKKSCVLQLILPNEPESQVLYEEVSQQCK